MSNNSDDNFNINFSSFFRTKANGFSGHEKPATDRPKDHATQPQQKASGTANENPLRISPSFSNNAPLENEDRNSNSSFEETQQSWVKDSVISILTQEMNALLSGVHGLEKVWQNTQSTDALLRYCAELVTHAAQVRHFIQDIHLLTEPNSIGSKIDKKSTNLGTLLNNCAAPWYQIAQRKGIDLITDIDPNLPKIITDPNRLGQIITQLLSNAVKHTPKGEVSLQLHASTLGTDRLATQIRITDNGDGLTQDQILMLKGLNDVTENYSDNAFDSFGGLGLLMIQRQTKLIGGRIDVDYIESLGTILTFDIIFPVENVTALSEVTGSTSSMRAVPMETAAPERKRHLDVLVVDDVKVNLHVAQLILKELGHNVFFAKDGLDALELCAAQKFDVILMDLRMPVMDGLKATQQLRQEAGPNRLTPVIGATGQASNRIRELCLAQGMQEYLVKPLRQNDVREAINSAFEHNIQAQEASL